MLARVLKFAVPVVLSLALVPPVLIVRARTAKSGSPRLHLIPDMDNQPRFKSQQTNRLFADGRAMRPFAEGTVARGRLRADDHLHRGRAGEDWATEFPMRVDDAVMRRGQERFTVFCAPCHGLDGVGRGIVAVRAEEREEATWVPPLSLHSEQIRKRPAGHLYNSITNGIRTMPSYAAQIPVEDRWAIVAYVRALQRSQHAGIADVPAEIRETLR